MTQPEGIKFRLPRSRSESEAASRVRRVLETGCRAVGEAFDQPDDDWDPMWLLVGRDWGLFVAGDLHKHAMAEMVGAMTRKLGAIAVGHLHSSWMVDAEHVGRDRLREINTYMERGGSLEELPERREVLLLNVHTASRSQTYTADITRADDAPPALEKFRLWDIPGGTVSGAMVDPLREGLVKLG